MTQADKDHFQYNINYYEEYLILLALLKEALDKPDFDRVKIIDAKIRILNVDKEIWAKTKVLEEYKNRLNTK